LAKGNVLAFSREISWQSHSKQVNNNNNKDGETAGDLLSCRSIVALSGSAAC